MLRLLIYWTEADVRGCFAEQYLGPSGLWLPVPKFVQGEREERSSAPVPQGRQSRARSLMEIGHEMFMEAFRLLSPPSPSCLSRNMKGFGTKTQESLDL